MKKIGLAATVLLTCFMVVVLIMACDSNRRADETIAEVDRLIESATASERKMPASANASRQNLGETQSDEQIIVEEETTAGEAAEVDSKPDIYNMDVWDLGLYLYGISYQDTSRALRIISYEGYGYSPLSYYVACCCWVRATENYWGYDNLYSAFGEADTSYDLWMDDLGIADYAYDYLWECYMEPTYVCYCNGMATPSDYIYYEDGIYVWN